MFDYNHRKIEPKWQKKWEKLKLGITADKSIKDQNIYVLVEFPYPSGNLHVGHWYAFCLPDIYVRFLRLQGKNVFFPIGFDAFGLPAENAALKHKINPRQWTYDNIDYMRRQLKTMGASFDWSREIITCDPEYYKWTQWLFLQFLKAGLAYRAETTVNWCPSCKTVLANEQVIQGLCERCDGEIVQKRMKQWLLRITDYAEKLLHGLDKLDWPEEIKEAQRQWIGRSEGARIRFDIVVLGEHQLNPRLKLGGNNPSVSGRRLGGRPQVWTFTTRPDTLFGATYLVLAPEHSLIGQLQSQITNWLEVENYINQAKKKTERERQETREKTGIELKGIKAINPATGGEIPIWIADYVLASYGTGAIMAVPAHDERDFEFARKFNLPIRQVVVPQVTDEDNPPREDKENTERDIVQVIVKHPNEDKIVSLRWKQHPWHTLVTGGIDEGESVIEATKREVYEETGYKNYKSIKELPYIINNKFYAGHKDVNRSVTTHIMLVELEDTKCDEVSAEDQALHEVEWIDIKDIKNLAPLSNTEFIIKWLEQGDHAYVGEGKCVNSDFLNGLDTNAAKEKIIRWLEEKHLGQRAVTYRLRDWVVSRQRYWGCPIPVIYCHSCLESSKSEAQSLKPAHQDSTEGRQIRNPRLEVQNLVTKRDGVSYAIVPVPEDQLPVKLPEIKDYQPTGGGQSPLAKAKDWVKVKCPRCGAEAERETDTLDTFVDSSWYFLRYTDPKNANKLANQEEIKRWLPVDLYSGGAEHTTMHLLYSRFWIKVMSDLGLVDFDEPYIKRLNRGLILGPDGQKMSKSRGNVVDPDEQVKIYGADTVRMYLAFIGPYNEVGAYPWNPQGIIGIRRYLEKVWGLVTQLTRHLGNRSQASHPSGQLKDSELTRLAHRTIKKVTEDIQSFKFNTAIAQLMIYTNRLTRLSTTGKAQLIQNCELLLTLLSPFAPHLSEELWQKLGHRESIFQQPWPSYDKKLIRQEEVELVVQVNGKVRDKLKVQAGLSETEAKERAFTSERIKKILAGRPPKKVIFVRGKLLNIVV